MPLIDAEIYHRVRLMKAPQTACQSSSASRFYGMASDHLNSVIIGVKKRVVPAFIYLREVPRVSIQFKDPRAILSKGDSHTGTRKRNFNGDASGGRGERIQGEHFFIKPGMLRHTL